MTAVAEALDLSRVTFAEDDPAEPCAWLEDGPCALEAVAVAVWEQPCRCSPDRQPLCARHRDRVISLDRQAGLWKCAVCDARVRLIRMEGVS
jgi:hypothetical protein